MTGADSSEQTSLSLLARVRAGESQAWQRLVALYRPLIFYWCRRAGIGDDDAEDVVQEVFQVAAQRIESFRRDRPSDSFRGWLCGITRNKILLLRRRQLNQPQAAGGSDMHRRMEQLEGSPDAGGFDADPDGAEPGDADAISELFGRALEQVRGEFASQTWTAFWRTVVAGEPPRNVADELGVSATAVRMAKSRVLRRLRLEVGDLVE
jgi:RNA polymerase sigma-70 factor (ECF subfamily)